MNKINNITDDVLGSEKMVTAITQGRLSNLLSLPASQLHGILHGYRRPSAAKAVHLEDVSGVERMTWLYSDHKEITRSLEKVYGKINFSKGRPKSAKSANSAKSAKINVQRCAQLDRIEAMLKMILVSQPIKKDGVSETAQRLRSQGIDPAQYLNDISKAKTRRGKS